MDKENVILNFPQATNVTFQGIGIFGNVLAPRAFVDFSNGQLNGTLVACSWCGYGQINFVPTAAAARRTVRLPAAAAQPGQRHGLLRQEQGRPAAGQRAAFARRRSEPDRHRRGGPRGHASATTNAGGIYSFGDLPAGTYAIQVNTPVGFAAGQSSAGAFGGESHPNVVSGLSIPAGQSSGGYNFAEVELSRRRRCLRWQPGGRGSANQSARRPDLRRQEQDGLVQDDEKRLKGVVVVLTGRDYTGKKVTVRTTTDATGAYNFEGLAAGTYTISVRTPARFRAGRSSAGILGGQAKPNKITGITIPAGQIVDGYNFGQVRNCARGPVDVAIVAKGERPRVSGPRKRALLRATFASPMANFLGPLTRGRSPFNPSHRQFRHPRIDYQNDSQLLHFALIDGQGLTAEPYDHTIAKSRARWLEGRQSHKEEHRPRPLTRP